MQSVSYFTITDDLNTHVCTLDVVGDVNDDVNDGGWQFCGPSSWCCFIIPVLPAINHCVSAADDPTQQIPVNIRGSPSRGFDVEYTTIAPGNESSCDTSPAGCCGVETRSSATAERQRVSCTRLSRLAH